jgi:hypothetical protein
MKKYIFLFAFFFAANSDAIDWNYGWDAEIRVAAFHPDSHLYRKIYHEWVPDYQIEVNKYLFQNFYGWANISYHETNGHSIGLHDHTSLREFPIGVGFKYFYPFSPNKAVYAGLGLQFSFLNVKNNSHCIRRHVNKQEFGGVLKTGFRMNFHEYLYLDIFGDYIYQKFHTNGEVNTGGIKLGAGLGRYF